MTASGGGNDEGAPPGKDSSPTGGASVDDAEAKESGYRRDDYWREEARDDIEPGTEPEPEGGFAFESSGEKAESSGGGADDAPRAEEAREQGNAGGRDDANIVEKG